MKQEKQIKPGTEKHLAQIVSYLIAVLLAFLIGGCFIALAGANPLEAYSVLFRGAFGSPYAWSETLLRATPLLLAGIGLAVSFRCRLTSIGSEGQIIIGALASTALGLNLSALSPVLAVPLCLIAGFLAGALYAAIAGILKAKMGVSEIICTIMLNYVAISLLSLLLDNGLREAGSSYPQSPPLSEGLSLPTLFAGNRLHFGFILALISVLLYYIYMFRTSAGYQLRIVGQNPRAAEYAGINVAGSIIFAMFLSGGMGGLAGSVEILGIHHRLYNDFAAGVGFDAMAVALLGRLNPLGVLIASIFFAALETGSSTMQRTMQIPTSIVSVIQGLLILLIYTDKLYSGHLAGLFKRLLFGRAKKEAAK